MRPVSGVYLACCVRGLEVTRHFTFALGNTVTVMLAAALLAGGIAMIAFPLLRIWESRR